MRLIALTQSPFLRWMLPTLALLFHRGRRCPKPVQKAKPAARPSEQKTIAHPRLERDPMIAQIMKDVSPERIRQTIEKLVSFGTRSTLSVNNPGAATSKRESWLRRNWIKSEFERYSADCRGCLNGDDRHLY